MKYFLMGTFSSAVLFCLVGCAGGPTVVPVNGVAMRKGAPVKGLRVTFVPEEGGRGSQSSRPTDAQGHFEMSFEKGTKGASVGRHKVIVAFMPPSPKDEVEFYAGTLKLHPDQDVILAKYGPEGTNPLVVEVKPSDQDVVLALD